MSKHPKLDKTQPYASISGDEHGRVFEQNHTFYGADGLEWVDNITPEVDNSAPAAAVEDSAKALVARNHGKKAVQPVASIATSEADAQLQAQLGGESAE